MARAFTGSADSTAPVDQIHAAFGREDYWRDRLATGEAVTTLDGLDVGDDGTIVVRYRLDVGRRLLPGMVAKLLPGDVTMRYEETWEPGERVVAGQIAVTVSGGLGSCNATTRLEPTATGSALRFDGRVEVKIPLMGANLEKAIGTDLARNIPSVMDFTTTWIAANG